MTESLEQLIEDASRGDQAAVEVLLHKHLDALHAFIRLRAGELISAKESTADLAQSVCREVLQDASKFRFQGEGAFKRWLFTQALHKIIDRNRHYRRARRDAAREARAPAPASEAEAAGLLEVYGTLCTPSRVAMAREELERVEGLFRQLPEPQREAITLSRIAGLSYAEIAEQTGRTVASVRGLVARGLVRLSALMAGKG